LRCDAVYSVAMQCTSDIGQEDRNAAALYQACTKHAVQLQCHFVAPIYSAQCAHISTVRTLEWRFSVCKRLILSVLHWTWVALACIVEAVCTRCTLYSATQHKCTHTLDKTNMVHVHFSFSFSFFSLFFSSLLSSSLSLFLFCRPAAAATGTRPWHLLNVHEIGCMAPCACA
jgi:hypothetical protein